MICFARTQWLMLLLAAIPMEVQAEDCLPLKPVASVAMEGDHTRQVIIPVSINNTPRHFLFDTGGALPHISSTVVTEMKLDRRPSPFETYDVDGNVSREAAIVHDFAVGPFKGQDLQLQIDALRFTDGLLTPSLFQKVDLDLDFGRGRFNLFLADHCSGRVVYWKADVLAAVPFILRSNHFNISVTVDGHELKAIIDTGATSTFMNADIAKRVFGLTPDSPDMVAAGNANNDSKLPIFRHVFGSLGFDGINVSNPRISIMPDRLGANDGQNRARTGSFIHRENDDLDRPDIVIGMNILSKLHLYFATNEKTVYITPATAPVGQANDIAPTAPGR